MAQPRLFTEERLGELSLTVDRDQPLGGQRPHGAGELGLIGRRPDQTRFDDARVQSDLRVVIGAQTYPDTGRADKV